MQTNPASDLALRVLRLEQQIEAYQRLHAAELNELRQSLADVKSEVLCLATRPDRAPSPAPGGAPTTN